MKSKPAMCSAVSGPPAEPPGRIYSLAFVGTMRALIHSSCLKIPARSQAFHRLVGRPSDTYSIVGTSI